MFKTVFTLFFTIILISCSSTEPPQLACNGNGYNSIPTEYYGKWHSIYTATEIDVDNCTPAAIDTVTSTNTQLAVTNYNTTSYSEPFSDTWIRRPAVPSTVRVKISSPFRTSSQNLDLCPPQTIGVCAAQIFLNHTQTNEEITTNTDTFDTNSETIIPDVPPGEYTLTAEVSDSTNTVEVTDTVTITDIETQLGTYNVVDSTESNFKTEIVLDKSFVYGDYETYFGNIITTNIGNSEAQNLTYSFDTTHASIESATIISTQLGSIPLGGTSVTRFAISFKYIDTTFSDIPIPVQITVNSQDTWHNTAHIRVYKNKVIVQATSTNPDSSNAANGRMHGYLITDNLKYTSLYAPVTTITESFPYIPNQEHHLILSSNDFNRQIRYSLAVNNNALPFGALNLLTSLSSFEPNDSIETSQQLNLGDVVNSYTYKDDVDSYSIYMPDDPRLHAAVSLIYSAHMIYDGNYLDDTGNSDGILNRGENIYLTLGVKNLGTSNSAQTLITLSTDDPNVTIENLTDSASIQNRTVQLNGLESRDTGSSLDRLDTHTYYLLPYKGFKIAINSAMPLDQTEITVTITATETARGEIHTDTFTIPVQ